MVRFRSTVIQFWLEYIIIYLSVSLTVWPPVRPHERFSIALNWFLPHFYLSVFLRGMDVDSSFRVSVVAVCFYSLLRFLNCTIFWSLWKSPVLILFSFKNVYSLHDFVSDTSEWTKHSQMAVPEFFSSLFFLFNSRLFSQQWNWGQSSNSYHSNLSHSKLLW